MDNGTVLVTGAAGFIGAHVCHRLLSNGRRVVGIDNMNDYYSVELKQSRLEALLQNKSFTFIKADIADLQAVRDAFTSEPSLVINLAAQAGVRFASVNPSSYIQSNLVGFANILEACRNSEVDHLVYASSSSVYGANSKVPFSEGDRVDKPVSLYAATKRANELLAYSYSENYGLPTTGLRFFTVYGPQGRPDMAYYAFTTKYFSGEPITIYNGGDVEHDLYRDFTYIDDVVEGLLRIASRRSEDKVPAQIFNIGNSHPVKLMDFIATLEDSLSAALGRRVALDKQFAPIATGDVSGTFSDSSALQSAVGFKPATSLADGLQKFAEWYVRYHNCK